MTQGDDQNEGQKSGKASRLTQHYAILGLESGKVSEAELSAERKAMQSATPLPLHFPTERSQPVPSKAWWQQYLTPPRLAIPLVAVAAAALIIVMVKRQPNPDWQVMGGSVPAHVKVFYEQNGEVHPWTSGVALTNGTRIKAEVHATQATTAFWGVVGRGDKLLSEPAWIWDNRLAVGINESKPFSGSLQLEGASEGESLVVASCPTPLVEAFGVSAPANIVRLFRAAPLTGQLSECHVDRFNLRP